MSYSPRRVGPFVLQWQGEAVNPRSYWNVIGSISGQVPEANLFSSRDYGGLTGELYPNLNFEGKPLTKRVDPEIIFHWLDNPIQSIFSIRWKGKLKVDRPGVYAFQAPVCAYSLVRVDGSPVYRQGAPLGVENAPVKPDIILNQGWHNIEVEYSVSSCVDIDFLWRPPGDPSFSAVPFTQLRPEI